MAVCDKTFQIYSREPYANDVLPIAPRETIPLAEAMAFDCKRTTLRHPRETKGLDYDLTDLSGAACCEPGSNCC